MSKTALLNKKEKSLILRVCAGNPGAMTIISSREAIWFDKWLPCLRWLEKQGVVGSKIWEDVKDNYNMDIHSWFRKQINEMEEDYQKQFRESRKPKMIFE